MFEDIDLKKLFDEEVKNIIPFLLKDISPITPKGIVKLRLIISLIRRIVEIMPKDVQKDFNSTELAEILDELVDKGIEGICYKIPKDGKSNI